MWDDTGALACCLASRGDLPAWPLLLVGTAPQVRPIGGGDFVAAMSAIKPSASRDQLQRFEAWTRYFGTTS